MLDITEQVKEKIKNAKAMYGLNYSTLARTIGIQPTTLYMFLNGQQAMSKTKQLQALYIVEEYEKEFKEKYRSILGDIR